MTAFAVILIREINSVNLLCFVRKNHLIYFLVTNLFLTKKADSNSSFNNKRSPR